jgi:aminoglycoside phosphotransferase (APT) family kinase protein
LSGDLLAEQFPQWAHLPVMPVAYDGWDNRTFCLGNELSVRLPSAEGYAAQVPKEHRWLPLLAPHLPKEIPVPVALGSPTADYPFHWSVYRWLVGEIALHAQDLDKTRLAVDVAEFIICFHLIPVHDGPHRANIIFYGAALCRYMTVKPAMRWRCWERGWIKKD